jgi:hypothetical protein
MPDLLLLLDYGPGLLGSLGNIRDGQLLERLEPYADVVDAVLEIRHDHARVFNPQPRMACPARQACSSRLGTVGSTKIIQAPR